MVAGLSNLKDFKYFHRNLKPENILKKNGHIKITDYRKVTLKKGTTFYLAPEVLEQSKKREI